MKKNKRLLKILISNSIEFMQTEYPIYTYFYIPVAMFLLPIILFIIL